MNLFGFSARQIRAGMYKGQEFVDYHLFDGKVQASWRASKEGEVSMVEILGHVCVRVFTKEVIVVEVPEESVPKDGKCTDPPAQHDPPLATPNTVSNDRVELDDYIAPPLPALIRSETLPTIKPTTTPTSLVDHSTPDPSTAQPRTPTTEHYLPHLLDPVPDFSRPPASLPQGFINPMTVLPSIQPSLEHLNKTILARFTGETIHTPNLLCTFNYLHRQVFHRVSYLQLVFAINQNTSDLHAGLTVLGLDLYEGVIALVDSLAQCCLATLYYFARMEEQEDRDLEGMVSEYENPRERLSGHQRTYGRSRRCP
ncbi:hypothetical protein JAAARDRAFT_195900 [Jaapia argillacea MUCL 33604]|uniref:Uncharacterized protein n=1 Tax=Jaapia argillacea MUCL 33604 TaxID=933084 RepID=A0A067PKW7_9AGAM|nr:hypothetical protein JAAARDRAFT_195900 [Jaapia argillacea MUCL 33604]